MTRKQTKRAMFVATIASSLFLLNFVWAASSHGPHAAQPVSLSQLHGETVPGAMKALMAARKALQAGHTEHALAEKPRLTTPRDDFQAEGPVEPFVFPQGLGMAWT